MREKIATDQLSRTRRMVLTALFFGMALLLSLVEGAMPPVPIPVPGVKLGLSNIVVMYLLFFLGRGPAVSVAVLKAGFVGMTRGIIAGFVSLGGGLCAVGIMALLLSWRKDKISYFMLSMVGAVFHNVGQFAVISVIYANSFLWPYLPVLLLFGMLAGFVTSALFQVIMPAVARACSKL